MQCAEFTLYVLIFVIIFDFYGYASAIPNEYKYLAGIDPGYRR